MLEHSHSSLDSTSFNVTKILITSWYHFPFNRFNKNIFFNSAIISKWLPRVKECLMLGTLTWNPPYFVRIHVSRIIVFKLRLAKHSGAWNHAQSGIVDFQSPPISRSITFIYGHPPSTRWKQRTLCTRSRYRIRTIHNYETNQT